MVLFSGYIFLNCSSITFVFWPTNGWPAASFVLLRCTLIVSSRPTESSYVSCRRDRPNTTENWRLWSLTYDTQSSGSDVANNSKTGVYITSLCCVYCTTPCINLSRILISTLFLANSRVEVRFFYRLQTKLHTKWMMMQNTIIFQIHEYLLKLVKNVDQVFANLLHRRKLETVNTKCTTQLYLQCSY